MRAAIMRCLLGDLSKVGFVKGGKVLVLASEETVQTITVDVMPYRQSDDNQKRVDIYFDTEDKLHPKDKTLRVSKYGDEFERIDYVDGPSKVYVFNPDSLEYDNSRLHQDITKYGIGLFDLLKTTKGYFDYLLGDAFRHDKRPLGLGAKDEEHALIALDLALQLGDTERADKAIAIVNRSLQNHDASRREAWIKNKKSLSSVADRISSKP